MAQVFGRYPLEPAVDDPAAPVGTASSQGEVNAGTNGVNWVSPASLAAATTVAHPVDVQDEAAARASEDATLQTAVALLAPLSSPALTGTPTAPTAAPGTNTAQLATTAFVAALLQTLVGGAPGSLNTFLEVYSRFLADESTAVALTNLIAGKLASANNLSDLANAVTARVNLGLGSAATLGVGTAAGDVVALDNFARLPAVDGSQLFNVSGGSIGTVIRGADMSGATDATAIVQALHDALPPWGGRIIKPPGRLLIAGTVNISKPIVWVDAGSGPAGQDATFGNAVVTTSAAAPMFAVTSTRAALGEGATFLDTFFLSLNSAPTAGAFLAFQDATGMHLERCSFRGGYQHVAINNGYSWTISNCIFVYSLSHSLTIADVASQDAGDPSVVGCTFGTGPYAIGSTNLVPMAGSAAIFQQSGGGLKCVNVKFNGPINGVNGYAYGVLVLIPANTGTSDLLISNCSVENVTTAGIRVAFAANTGTFGKVSLVGNQISLIPGSAVILGDSPNGSTPLQNVLLLGNQVENCGAGILVDNVYGGLVGQNYYDATTPHCLTITARAANITVARQARNGTGYVVENAGTSVAPDQGDRGVYFVGAYPAPQVMYRLAVPYEGGGRISIVATGSVPGYGAYCAIATRSYFRHDADNVTIATVGTDTAAGNATQCTVLGFDVTSVNGEIQITQTLTIDLGFSCKYEVSVDGDLTSFKIGP